MRTTSNNPQRILAITISLTLLVMAGGMGSAETTALGSGEVYFQVHAVSYDLTIQVQGEGTTEPTVGTHTYPTGGVLYHEDFEVNAGGYVAAGTSDNWQWGTPVTWPGQAASGSECWGTNLDGHYDNNANEVLTSPIISLGTVPSGTPVQFAWMQALRMESAVWDHAYAEVSINEGEWVQMWAHSGSDATTTWQQMTYDISAAAEGTVQFRWRIATDGSVTYDGYYIDDVTITAVAVPITAAPAEGWEFTHWDGDVVDPASAATTVIMDNDKTITANFRRIAIPVASPQDLDAIRNTAVHTFASETEYEVTTAGGLDKHYRQVADIDLGTMPWNDSPGWQPLGDEQSPFIGTYDGDGYVINGLTMSRADKHMGLFGVIGKSSGLDSDNAIIADVTLNDVLITADGNNTNSSVGGLVGSLNSVPETAGSFLVNCYSSGTITANIYYSTGGLIGSHSGTITDSGSSVVVTGSTYTGGLVGSTALRGTITDCFATGSVTGVPGTYDQGQTWQPSSHIGGLVGMNYGTAISRSHAAGTVQGHTTAGGLVGCNDGTADVPGEIIDCYAVGYVTGDQEVGGLIGHNTDNAAVRQTYAIGAVAASANAGGLVGVNNGSVQQSLYDLCTAGKNDTGKGEGLFTSDMMQAATYIDWSTQVWVLENDSYPYLTWQTDNFPEPPVKNTLTLTAEEGGTVSGAGDYYCGDDVTVTASPDQGYSFINWLEHDQQVSADAEYTFTITADRQLVATFGDAPPPPPPPPPPDGDPIPPEEGISIPPGVEVTVDFDDGRLTVTVPAGAITVAGILLITQVPDTDWPPVPEVMTVFYPLYQVLIEAGGEYSQYFDQPLQIQVAFDPDDLTGLSMYKIHIFYWDEHLQTWMALPTDIDVSANTAQAFTSHLTRMTLMYDRDFPVLTDTAGHWARPYILTMASLRIIAGYPDQTFRPQRKVTRAEFAKMMVETLELEPIYTELPFTDTIPEWAVPYVQTAVHAGLFTGYDDGSFRPDDNITREQMAAVLARAAGADVAPDAMAEFADAGTIAVWAEGYVQAAVKLGLLTGYPDGTFAPQALSTRGEASTVLWRIINLLFR